MQNKAQPLLWTLSFSRHSVGHTKIPFCLQSCVKPLTYAISVSTLGTDYVHKFVGKEPSGLRYNKLSLNEEGEHLQGARLRPSVFPSPCGSLLPVFFTFSLVQVGARPNPGELQNGSALKQAFVSGQQDSGLCFPRNPP